ncbi:MAG: ABC transporter ATP-binding protein [Cyclobacteriaceae bacterium]|nr:ABC transporter ATP-binding protein [Cyclobacteriaceae bacterium]
MSAIRIESVVKKFGNQAAALKGVSLEIPDGEILALIGESGSGKTTLLRILAGLELPDAGIIEIGDQEVANDHTFVEAQHREIGLVFQDYALFPHMSAEENIAFGLHSWTAAQRQNRIQEVLELVGLSQMATRYPHQLSGGQQQRVALARALAPKPRMLLLDEPFSNLDTVLKDQVREDVRKIIKQSGLTAILVTHDIQDALSTADRIALLKDGTLQQLDTPVNLYNCPQNPYVAAFFGKINLIPARYQEGKIFTELISFPVNTAPNRLEGLLCVRPRQIKLVADTSGFPAEVIAREYQGDQLQFKVKTQSQYLWCQTHQEPIALGQQVRLRIEIEEPYLLKSD